MKETVEERIRQIILATLGVDTLAITPNASLVDDLGADSLDCVEIIMAVEEEFRIGIPDEEAEEIRTVQELVNFVSQKYVFKRGRQGTT
jgi:acyl carrier protein